MQLDTIRDLRTAARWVIEGADRAEMTHGAGGDLEKKALDLLTEAARLMKFEINVFAREVVKNG